MNSKAIADDNAWCVAKNFADEKVLQSNIDFACSNQVDCGPIQSGGSCFLPDTVYSHACFAMNSYFKLHKTLESCQFDSTGVIVTVDPSNTPIL
ncbi:hypothetical protein LWI29_008687 [Acer saccharum]|uniref:X8 domain-containing protein n=1 Tax=Acer saccharum TaxID=4024 RepID=A0AA39RTL1_ACESA|nr:hypothetical protein LWI29_008687 [Acer saccharum]KAK1592533.1 hypothetical protein Q3G72_026452 [Acer saccharum]